MEHQLYGNKETKKRRGEIREKREKKAPYLPLKNTTPPSQRGNVRDSHFKVEEKKHYRPQYDAS